MDRLWITITLLVAALVHGGYAADAVKELKGKGGVIVHVDAADSALLERLCKEQNNRLGHALVRSAATETAIREELAKAGLHGRITVSRWDGKTIPFVENFVNLLICPSNTPRAEVLRVLAPKSVALVGDERVVKPRPSTYDDWPQYLYDQSGNAVSNDTALKPPLGHIQWVGGPRWSRHHETMSSMSACVSGVGKVFYIFDEGLTFSPMLPSHWRLIARDAFNGTILWKREIPKWIPNLEKLKSGPATLPRRLVVVGDKLYVTLGVEAPVSVLDTATGSVIAVLKGTEGTEEMIYDGKDLFMVADVNKDKKELRQYPRFGSSQWVIRPKQILRWDLAGGKLLWKERFDYVAPLTLAGHLNKLYFFNGKQVQSLEKATGASVWTSVEMPVFKNMPTFFAPKLVVQGGSVMFAGGEGFQRYGSRGKLRGLSTETGKVLWTAPNPASGYRSPEDLFVIKGKAWAGDTYSHRWWGEGNAANATGEFTGVNIASGSIDKKINSPEAYWFHHRCHMAKATKNYLLMSRTGIEFIEPETGKWTLHHWIRGACLYGIMPANGMIYAPQHPCACYIGAKTFGFTAVAPKNPNRISLRTTPEDQRLTTFADAPFRADAKADEWPTYRGDTRRSGRGAKTDLPKATKWSVNLGDQLTPPAIAGGKIIVARKNKFAVIALDAKTGQRAWTFLPGARVDSTPTIYKGRVYFGSADGYVQCLSLDTGKLVWRYQAASSPARHMYFERLESVQPVHGNVLIMNDKLYTVAGRSMFVDGGIRLVILDARTGKLIKENIMGDKVPGTNEELQMQQEILNMPQALPDLLSTNGKNIYMRFQEFDLDGKRTRIDYTRKLYGKTQKEIAVANENAAKHQVGEGAHLFSATGFLDDSWWHRTYWIYGKHQASGWAGHYAAGKGGAPSGREICFDDKEIFCWGRLRRYFRWTPIYEYSLWACDHQYKRKWEVMMPLLVRAMVYDGDHLYIAGPDEVARQSKVTRLVTKEEGQELMRRQEQLLTGKAGARLLQVDAKTGKIVAGIKLNQAPEFDAMASAYGNLYLATMDGSLHCLGDSGTPFAQLDPAKIAEYNKKSTIPNAPARKKKGKKKSKKKGKAANADKLKFEFKNGQTVTATATPFLPGRGIELTVPLVYNGKDGVLTAQGGASHGYALWLKNGIPQWTVTRNEVARTVGGKEKLKNGDITLVVHQSKTGVVSIKLAGQEIASGSVGGTFAEQPSDALTVGQDSGSHVGPYGSDMRYPEKVGPVTIKLIK